MNTKNVPKKLWQWIDAAEKDVLEVADDPAYLLNMEVWHLPDDGVGHVCLAGAVMSRTLKMTKDYSAGVAMLPQKIRGPLTALDDFRALDFIECLEKLYPGGRGGTRCS